MRSKSFIPKLFSIFEEPYTLKIFSKDLTAGVIVGIVALPLSIAFAIASGVKPEQGLYTAIVAGFLISLLSGSRFQIGGPTGAFIVIVYSIVHKYGYDGLVLATIMAGVFLIVMGLARLGDMIQFIPFPVTVGFTSGIALIIFTTQIRDLLGLQIANMPEHFVGKWIAYSQALPSINSYSFLIGVITFVILILGPKITFRLPAPLVAILLTTILTQYFHWPVDTIFTRFGEVPNTLPIPHFPHITVEKIIQLSSPALAIALLAGIESLLSAVVADGMTGRRHRSNMELIAQGVANIASPMMGGIPATGAIARTATNIKSGGKTPIAGLIHAITILLIFLFFGKWAAFIPMATLSAILIVVAYNMSEWHLFGKILRGSREEAVVLLITFLLTVLVDLTAAIEVGVILACFLFMRKMIESMEVKSIKDSINEEDSTDDPFAISKRKVPENVEVFEINGPFFFGAADKFRDALGEIKRPPKVLILRLRHVSTMDITALKALEDVYERSRKAGTQILLSGVTGNLEEIIEASDLRKRIGSENILKDIDEALLRAEQIVQSK